MKKLALLLSLLMSVCVMAQKSDSPLRVGVSGVAHGHLWNLINAMNRGDFVIVGVAEENDDFRAHNNLVGRLPKEKFYASVDEMLDKEKPEVVVDYGSILHHSMTVEACAKRGIHVMVEKPLATTYKQALRMQELVIISKVLWSADSLAKSIGLTSMTDIKDQRRLVATACSSHG